LVILVNSTILYNPKRIPLFFMAHNLFSRNEQCFPK
jgi:hypothetical protein